VQPTPAPALPANLVEITLALTVAATLAVVAALTVSGIARRLLTRVGRETALTEPIALGTLRILRFMTFVVVLALLAFPALELAGVSLNVGLHPREIATWAAEAGIRIAVILLLAFMVVRVLTTVIMRTERDLAVGTGLDALERRKRAQTVASVVSRALSALVWSTAVLIVLRELDVDITPVLTGAGIVGLAIGFGAQTLVRDVISGVFYLFDDAFRVGEYIQSGSYKGTVESFSLRSVKLRHHRGRSTPCPSGSSARCRT
jgi:small-conductance mechanosensitive channel